MIRVSHPLVLGLFSTPAVGADAAGALHALGIPRESISVVAHTHADAQALADRMDATAGVDLEDSRRARQALSDRRDATAGGGLEDSRPAARLGELGGRVLATVALVMPGIGPIVAAGPPGGGRWAAGRAAS